MTARHPIAIIGGGLGGLTAAGLALAIVLLGFALITLRPAGGRPGRTARTAGG